MLLEIGTFLIGSVISKLLRSEQIKVGQIRLQLAVFPRFSQVFVPACLPAGLRTYIRTYVRTYVHTYIHTYVFHVATIQGRLLEQAGSDIENWLLFLHIHMIL